MEQGRKSYGFNGWLIAGAVMALLFFGSDYLDSRESSIMDPDEGTFSRGETTNETNSTETNSTEPAPKVKKEYDEESEYGPYEDYGEYGQTGYPFKNACYKENYGYPDYIGTDKDGLTCADAPSWERDYECIANPPFNYDGEIVLGYSNPKLTCCETDGTCQWVE